MSEGDLAELTAAAAAGDAEAWNTLVSRYARMVYATCRRWRLNDADAAIYHVVKQIIIASLHGHPQPLVIEAARSSIAHHNQPNFGEVFDGLRGR